MILNRKLERNIKLKIFAIAVFIAEIAQVLHKKVYKPVVKELLFVGRDDDELEEYEKFIELVVWTVVVMVIVAVIKKVGV
jgi:hypothetical protein